MRDKTKNGIIHDESDKSDGSDSFVRPPAATPEAPDGGFGWVVVFATFMQHVISLGIAYTLGVYNLAFRQEFNTDVSTTAWVAASHLGMLFMSGPFAGMLLAKTSTSTVSFLGAFICGVGCVGAAFANSIYLVIGALGLVAGFGNGFMFISAVTAVTRWFNKKRSLATGVAVCGAGFGVFGFAPVLRFLISYYGLTGALLLEAGFAFQGCIFALLLVPVPLRPTIRSKSPKLASLPTKVYVGPHRNVDSSGRLIVDMDEMKPLHEIASLDNVDKIRRFSVVPDALDMGSVLRNWIFWVFAFNQFFTFFSASGPLVFLYSRAVRDLLIEPQLAAWVVSIMGIFNTVGRLLFGILGNIYPRSRLYLLSFWIMAYGTATSICVFGYSKWSISLYAAVFGTGYGCMFSLTTVVLVDFFGVTLFGKIYGFIGTFRGIACLIGPPLGGWIVSQTGDQHNVLFLLTGSLGFIGGFALLLIPIGRKIAPSKL